MAETVQHFLSVREFSYQIAVRLLIEEIPGFLAVFHVYVQF